MTGVQSIDLERLQDGVCSYSQKKCAFAYEAAVFCLQSMGHHSGVQCRIDGWWEQPKTIAFDWTGILEDNTMGSWDDLNEMVEEGATALALLLVDEFTDFDLVRRAEQGRGIDFYIGYQRDFHKRKGFRVFAARLEVSGILNARSRSDVQRRVEEKQTQTKISDTDNNPAHVIVAEFGKPMLDWSQRMPAHGS